MADKDPKDLAKDFERLQKLATLLNKNLQNFNLDSLKNDANLVGELLEKWEGELSDATKSVESMASSFQDVVREIQKGNKGLRDTSSSFNKLTSLASDVSNHYRGINKLSKKQLESIEKQALAEKKRLEIALDTLEQDKQAIIAERQRGIQNAKQLSQLRKINAAQKEIKGTLNGENAAFEDLIINARNFLDVEKQIDKQTGAIGGLFEGIRKSFPNLSEKMGIDEAQAKMREMAEENIQNLQKEKDLTDQISKQRGNLTDKQIKAGFGGKELKNLLEQKESLSASNAAASGLSGKFKMLGEGAKVLGNNLKSALGPVGLIAMAIEKLVEAIIKTDEETGNLAKSMNVTYDQALGVRRELGNIAAMSLDSALNTKNLQETLVAVNSALGTNGKLAKEDLITFTKLREQAGMTNEEILGMQKYSMATGGSLEDNVKSFQASAKIMSYQKGVALNTKKLMAEMTNVSNRTKLSIQGGADGLAKAAVAAKLMGGNLEQAASMADSLLQFESSIENELSAELLLGKDINLEKARQAALNNDLATVAEEVTKQVGSAAEFSKMNRIQQEAAAKAVGMNADQLADMLVEQEALKSVGKALNDEEKAAYETAKQKYGAEKAAQMLKEGQLDSMVKQQGVQERFNQTLEKLQEIFVQIAEPILGILSPLMDVIGTLAGVISTILQPILSIIKAIGDGVKTFIQEPLEGLKEMFGGIVSLFSGDITEGLKSIGKGILRVVLTPIQAIISMGTSLINGFISMINAIPGVDIQPLKPLNLTNALFGDDILSPPPGGSGYGKRTLFGPEGAIQLNDKDTIVATTNPVIKGDDVMSAPKGAISVSNSTSPKKEVKEDPNAGINSRLDALIATTGKVNSVSTLKIQ